MQQSMGLVYVTIHGYQYSAAIMLVCRKDVIVGLGYTAITQVDPKRLLHDMHYAVESKCQDQIKVKASRAGEEHDHSVLTDRHNPHMVRGTVSGIQSQIKMRVLPSEKE